MKLFLVVFLAFRRRITFTCIFLAPHYQRKSVHKIVKVTFHVTFSHIRLRKLKLYAMWQHGIDLHVYTLQHIIHWWRFKVKMHLDKISTNISFTENDVATLYGYLHLCDSLPDTRPKITPPPPNNVDWYITFTNNMIEAGLMWHYSMTILAYRPNHTIHCWTLIWKIPLTKSWMSHNFCRKHNYSSPYHRHN